MIKQYLYCAGQGQSSAVPLSRCHGTDHYGAVQARSRRTAAGGKRQAAASEFGRSSCLARTGTASSCAGAGRDGTQRCMRRWRLDFTFTVTAAKYSWSAATQHMHMHMHMHAGGGGARFGPAAGRRCLPPRLHARTAAASSGASSARSTARTQWSTPRWCSS